MSRKFHLLYLVADIDTPYLFIRDSVVRRTYDVRGDGICGNDQIILRRL